MRTTGAEMKRSLSWVTDNLDSLIALTLAIALGLLGMLGIVSLKIAENAILITLGVLTVALLRDRSNRKAIERKADAASAAVMPVLDEFRNQLGQTATLDELIRRMQVTIEGLATMRTVKGLDTAVAFRNARSNTDRWMFKGGTGTYTRAVTLPECVNNARRDRRALQVRIEILDPTDEAVCERYASYRHSLAPRPKSDTQNWTTARTCKESYATILAARWHQQRFQLLDIAVALTQTMSTFRFDLSSSQVIITQDDPQFPSVQIRSGTQLYDGYVTELQTSFGQARRVSLEKASAVNLGDEPTITDARDFFNAIDTKLPSKFSDEDVAFIIERAIHPVNPYPGPEASTEEEKSQPSSAT
jgi:hypothetical protein